MFVFFEKKGFETEHCNFLVQSQILTPQEIHMFEGNADIAKYSHWKMIFSTRVDGDAASAFHSKCDGKSPILFVVKSKTYNNVFGGYSHIAFRSVGPWIRDDSMKNWLFRVR